MVWRIHFQFFLLKGTITLVLRIRLNHRSVPFLTLFYYIGALLANLLSLTGQMVGQLPPIVRSVYIGNIFHSAKRRKPWSLLQVAFFPDGIVTCQHIDLQFSQCESMFLQSLLNFKRSSEELASIVKQSYQSNGCFSSNLVADNSRNSGYFLRHLLCLHLVIHAEFAKLTC